MWVPCAGPSGSPVLIQPGAVLMSMDHPATPVAAPVVAWVPGAGPAPLQLCKALLSWWLLAWVQEERDSPPLREPTANNLTMLQ